MIAIIRTGGKQYLVQPKQIIQVEKLNAKEGDQLEFETLLTADEQGKNVQVGTPYLSTQVKGQVTKQGLGKKVDVVKFKAKIRYSRKYGHRQPFTSVMVTDIA